MTHIRTLRLTFSNGFFNEYRLIKDRLEFRAYHSDWRGLDGQELAVHLSMRADLARWLKDQLGKIDARLIDRGAGEPSGLDSREQLHVAFR